MLHVCRDPNSRSLQSSPHRVTKSTAYSLSWQPVNKSHTACLKDLQLATNWHPPCKTPLHPHIATRHTTHVACAHPPVLLSNLTNKDKQCSHKYKKEQHRKHTTQLARHTPPSYTPPHQNPSPSRYKALKKMTCHAMPQVTSEVRTTKSNTSHTQVTTSSTRQTYTDARQGLLRVAGRMADKNSNFPGSKPKGSWMVVNIHVGRNSSAHFTRVVQHNMSACQWLQSRWANLTTTC